MNDSKIVDHSDEGSKGELDRSAETKEDERGMRVAVAERVRTGLSLRDDGLENGGKTNSLDAVVRWKRGEELLSVVEIERVR